MVRVKRRYFTLKFNPQDSKNAALEFNEYQLLRCLREVVQDIHGDFGLGSLLKSLTVKKLCPQTKIAVVSCQRGPHELLSTSIPFVHKVSSLSCSLQVIYLSGTFRSSLKFLMRKYGRENKELEEQLKKRTDKKKKIVKAVKRKKEESSDDE